MAPISRSCDVRMFYISMVTSFHPCDHYIQSHRLCVGPLPQDCLALKYAPSSMLVLDSAGRIISQVCARRNSFDCFHDSFSVECLDGCPTLHATPAAASNNHQVQGMNVPESCSSCLLKPSIALLLPAERGISCGHRLPSTRQPSGLLLHPARPDQPQAVGCSKRHSPHTLGISW